MAKVKTNGGQPEGNGDIRRIRNVFGIEIFPQTEVAKSPEHCPENIASAFLQAEENLRGENYDAATAMDRKAIELATKEIAPELASKNLNDRINKIASDYRITPALQDWAHQLRTFGNQALHDIEGMTEEEATQAHDFAKYFLIYVFTLPKRIELARKNKSESV